MIRHLFGRIAALWRPAAVLPDNGWLRGERRGRPAAKETETMNAHGSAGGIGPTADEAGGVPASAGHASVAAEDLLARAMISIGIDFDDFARRESLWLRDMRLVCRSCTARSRCRRDLGTGDFARRYRHYCPNADSLARIAAGRHLKTGATRPTPQA